MASMSTASVTNDLQTPIEVAFFPGDWRVLYPQKSFEGVADKMSLIQVRLRECTEVGSCQAEGGASLRASVDFEVFSQWCKGRERAEARELAREAKRREEAQKRSDEMIRAAAAKKRDAQGLLGHVFVIGCFFVLPLALLILCVVALPGSAFDAAMLACTAVLLCCCLSACGGTMGVKDATSEFEFGSYVSRTVIMFRLVWLLALISLAAMTALHVLQGHWWTAFLIWPGAACASSCYLCVACGGIAPSELDAKSRRVLAFEKAKARFEISNKTIRFEGSVIRERGRPCVASWPGKYAGAWESLVSQSRDGQVSAAVVFLPEGTSDYGKHDVAEGLPMRSCWCTPLYGEQKPWGCRWFTKWKENIEIAVASGAQLEIYFFQGQVGHGKVDSFESAGEDSLRRENINEKQKLFEESPQFQQALEAGLGNLSQEPRGDGSSQYSREVRRLFLASLPEAEREFITVSEGLGNSQKAEVAWLEKKGYEYWGVDVATWLPGEGAEICFPASSQRELPTHGRERDFPSVSVPVDLE